MPELPEVEVVKRSLERKIQNLDIKKVIINETNLRYRINPNDLSKLKGLKIKKITRRSKFLLFHFKNSIIMLAHLGMTGKFFFVSQNNRKSKTSFYYNLNEKKDNIHNRVIFHFKGRQKLIYNDVRKFGFLKFYNEKNYNNSLHLKRLGPEPLSKNFNFKYFKHYIKNKNRPVKNLLMDQTFISGLGNIYANEILFSSKIKPIRKAKNLKDLEIKRMLKITKNVLKKSIMEGGSSVKNFSSLNGKKGSFQQKFNVYGKQGKNCSNADCKKRIIKIKISNRATFFCPACQKY